MNLNSPGQYELQQRLDSSSIEETWKAFDTQRRLYISLKRLNVAAQAPANLLPHFSQEMGKVATLRQPNIVPLLDYHVTPISDGSHDVVVITKYIEGPSLTDYLNSTVRKGIFPAGQELIQLLTPIATALDYAHQRSILHSGIKPANILFDKLHTDSFPLGEPYLTGFGLQQLHPLLALPLEDIYYISPEVARGYIGSGRSDLYSLGVILYELCTGVVPFQGDTPTDVITQHIHALPASPSLMNPHIRPAMTAVMMRALAKEPEARFSTCMAMVVALAKAYNLPVREDMSRSGAQSLSGISVPLSLSYLNVAEDGQDPMNSPTYLSNPPRTFLPGQAAGPISNQPTAIPAAVTPVLPNVSATPVLPVDSIPISSPISVAPPPTKPIVPEPSVALSASRKRFVIILSAIIIVVLLGSTLVGLFVLRKPSTSVAGTSVIGHAFFVSSGLINLTSNEGIADGVQLSLSNLPPAQAGNQYYAWLLADNDNNPSVPSLLLGVIPAAGETVNLTYPGDALHSDLLANYSRLLITEESVSPVPVDPSLDTRTWHYYAAFSQVPNPADTVEHFSLLNHFRHLLAQDPKLKAAGLTGGLDIWLFRNTEKILEYAGSARDAQQQGAPDLTHRQLIRILDYLDGSQYIATEGLPPTPLLIDPTIARVALLEFDVQNQTPPGYLKHIHTHLVEIVECPGVTAEQRILADQINSALNNVQASLSAVHTDAAQLVRMNDTQLQQPQAAALLDHLFTDASSAFTGQVDPNTNQVIPGVVQIHYNIQRLATMDITACTGTGINPCI